MKRVIVNGKHKFEHVGVCHRCGCTFECTSSDIHQAGNNNGLVAVCPECGELYIKMKDKWDGVERGCGEPIEVFGQYPVMFHDACLRKWRDENQHRFTDMVD